MDYDALAKKLDSAKVLSRFDEFLPEFQKAFQMGWTIQLPAGINQAKRIIGLGMGGSGMGYTLLSALAKQFGTIPLEVLTDYHLPPCVKPDTAICVTSFSGNTEETLSAAEDARRLGCPIVCITTGGKLAEWAKKYNLPLVQFTYPVAPRIGLPYTFGIAFGVLCRAHFLDFGEPADQMVPVAINMIQKIWPNERLKTKAIELTKYLADHVIYTVGSGLSYAAAICWKIQFNENSKVISFAEMMPEMCHNTFLGLKNPDTVLKSLAVIFLDSYLDHPQNRKRVKLVGDELKAAGALVIHPLMDDLTSPLALLLGQILLGDYISFYLALNNGEDPVEMDRIENLKKKLA